MCKVGDVLMTGKGMSVKLYQVLQIVERIIIVEELEQGRQVIARVRQSGLIMIGNEYAYKCNV